MCRGGEGSLGASGSPLYIILIELQCSKHNISELSLKVGSYAVPYSRIYWWGIKFGGLAVSQLVTRGAPALLRTHQVAERLRAAQ